MALASSVAAVCSAEDESQRLTKAREWKCYDTSTWVGANYTAAYAVGAHFDNVVVLPVSELPRGSTE